MSGNEQTSDDVLNEMINERDGNQNSDSPKQFDDNKSDYSDDNPNDNDVSNKGIADFFSKLVGKGNTTPTEEELYNERMKNDIENLFDDDKKSLDDGNNNKDDKKDDPIAQLAKMLGQQKELDDNSNKTDMEKWTDSIFGEGVKFDKLFAEDAEPEEIREEINTEIKSVMANFAQQVLTQAVRLSGESVKQQIAQEMTTMKNQQSMNDGLKELRQELPFTNQAIHKSMATNLFKQAMVKSNFDKERSLQLVEYAYKQSNPALFDNIKSRGFRSPSSSSSNSNDLPETFALNLDTIKDFMN